MRIIAGQYKGRTIKTLKGRKVRPTSDRVREAIFSILGDHVSGARVLDLFAGSGALGLEALSRGGEFVLFIEKDPKVVGVIKSNIRALRAGERTDIWSADVTSALRRLKAGGQLFDLVFLDPPYRKKIAEEILKFLGKGEILNDDAIVVAEHESDLTLADSYGCLELYSRKTYGDTSVSFYLYGKPSSNGK